MCGGAKRDGVAVCRGNHGIVAWWCAVLRSGMWRVVPVCGVYWGCAMRWNAVRCGVLVCCNGVLLCILVALLGVLLCVVACRWRPGWCVAEMCAAVVMCP